MELQQILAMIIVAAAAALLIRRYARKKKMKGGACENCECGKDPVAGATLEHPAKSGTFRREP